MGTEPTPGPWHLAPIHNGHRILGGPKHQVLAAIYPTAKRVSLPNGLRMAAALDMFEALECADDATHASASGDEAIDGLYRKWEPRMAPYLGIWTARKPDVSKESKLRLLAVQLRRAALAKARGERLPSEGEAS